MTEFKEAGLIEGMRQTSRGWRCAICFRSRGRIEQGRSDGLPLSEVDRCAGCGETVCDRHVNGPTRDAHPNGLNHHLAMREQPQPRQRIEVTEVKEEEQTPPA